MYNRIDLPLQSSRAAGLVAAAPWLMLMVSAAVIAGHDRIWVTLAIPLALAGAIDRWRRQGSLTHPHAVVGFLASGPRLFARLANGTTTEVRPLPHSRLCGPVMWLALRETQGTRRIQALLIPRRSGGNASSQPLRRLRTWLRLMPGPADPVPSRSARQTPLQQLWTGGKPHD